MCDFTILQSRTPAEGNDVTYSVNPPVAYPCRVTVWVNRAAVTDLGVNGPLRVIGIGGARTVTVLAADRSAQRQRHVHCDLPRSPPGNYTRKYVIDAGVVTIAEPSGNSPIELPKTRWQPRDSREDEDHNQAAGAREDAGRERFGEPKGREEKGRIAVPGPDLPEPTRRR